MKKVKKMAIGGVGAKTQAQMQTTQGGGLSSKNASQAFQSAGMNVNLPTGQRGFSSTPTMGGVGTPPATSPAGLNLQKLNTTPPPRMIVPQQLTAQQARRSEAAYKKQQQRQQAANSMSLPMQSIKSLGQANPQLATPIGGAEARALGWGMKKGGAVKIKSGGKANNASKRGDGIAQRGKTKGRLV